MGKPPKVNKSGDFGFDVPDLKKIDLVKRYKKAIKKVILKLRQSVLVNGTLSRDLMLLLEGLGKHTEVQALFKWGAHARHLENTPRCRFAKKIDCVMFTAIVLVYRLHQFEAGDVEESKIEVQLAKLKALEAHGLSGFKVKGDDKNGYCLRLKGCK